MAIIGRTMLEYSEITEHKYIVFENEPYEVLGAHVFRKQEDFKRNPKRNKGETKRNLTNNFQTIL